MSSDTEKAFIDSPQAPLLRSTLQVAVPLWIERVRRYSWEERLKRAHLCSEVIASKGDVILFRGKKGESANAFNHLAEGLACLAFFPGGVRFLGDHYCSEPQPTEPETESETMPKPKPEI